MFKLTGPNPLVKNQSHWLDGFTLHNFDPGPKPPDEKIVTEPPAEITPEVPATVEQPVNTEKIWVLPAVQKEIIDELYQEKRISWGFGEKFQSTAEILGETDLATILKIELPVKSIVFIPSQKRWWVVNRVADGASECSPSQSHPSF